MRNKLTLPILFAVLILSAAVLFGGPGIPFAGDPGSLVMIAMAVPAAPAAARLWGRKREPMKTFGTVAASTVSTSKVPRYPRTILGFMLQRGGTTFAASDLTRIEMFLGEKSIWGPVSGTVLADVNRFIQGNVILGDAVNDRYFTVLDFTSPTVKEIGGEQIGGLDLTTLPAGELRLETELGAGAVAPTLTGHTIWSAPQGPGDLAGLMQKLVQRVYPAMQAGDNYPDVNLRGAILLRQFFRYTVATAAVSTAAGISEGANTGNGVMGAITVTARTPCGRYRLKIVAAAVNAGTFIVEDPFGRLLSTGTVGVAFSAGGLAFTLADGAADFVAGDGFYIDVLPNNTDGNLNLVEIKKNEDIWWSRTDRATRFEQQRYGRVPLTQMYVADFLLDNHADSVIDTANAVALDYRVNLTATDTLTIIHQVLASPTLF